MFKSSRNGKLQVKSKWIRKNNDHIMQIRHRNFQFIISLRTPETTEYSFMQFTAECKNQVDFFWQLLLKETAVTRAPPLCLSWNTSTKTDTMWLTLKVNRKLEISSRRHFRIWASLHGVKSFSQTFHRWKYKVKPASQSSGSASQSVGQPVTQSVNQPIRKSVGQSVSQSVSQSARQSVS